MTRRRRAFWLLAALALLAPGCSFHLARVDVNRPVRSDLYASITLGTEGQRAVLDRLGPPDEILYTPTELAFDYVAVSHRGTDLRAFVPTDVVPFFSPTFLLSLQRFFFDLSSEPEEFEPTFAEGIGRTTANVVLRLIPFTSGEDILILQGHQLRADRLRVVFERPSLVAVRKALRLTTGEYAEESLADRVFLRSGVGE